MITTSRHFKGYNKLIDNALSAHREKGGVIYYESHHIIPKCLGGSNEDNNLVLLTAKEHFVAHLLITKFLPDNKKLASALNMMVCSKSSQARDYTPAMYKIARELHSGSNNINGKIIDIYDEHGELKYSSYGQFKGFCKQNNLPFNALKCSYQNNGTSLCPEHALARHSTLSLKYKNWSALERAGNNPLTFHKGTYIKPKKHFKSKIVDIYDNNGMFVETLSGIIPNIIKDKYPRVLLSSISNGGEPILVSNYSFSQVEDKFKKYRGWFGVNRTKVNKKYLLVPIQFIEPKKITKENKHQNSQTIDIYNSDDILVYTSTKSLNRFCDSKGLPYKALRHTLSLINCDSTTGCYTKQKCRISKYREYKGWYAKHADIINK